jgi:hypothetical protein
MAQQRDYHVIPNPAGGWSVRRAGADRASGVFSRQSDAVEHARELARNAHAELIVHGKDGRIRNGTTSQRDQLPPKERPGDRSASAPKGFGSLRGKLVVRRGIDLTKPIFRQATRESRKAPRGSGAG